MKIYLAATYARAPEMKTVANWLRARGHEITSACWHDETDEEKREEYETWERERWQPNRESVSFEQWCAGNDVRGIRDADMLVMRTDDDARFQSTGGRHLELGLALGLGGKYLIVVGEPENVFHHAKVIQCYPTWDAFFAALPAYEHAHLSTYQLRKDHLRGA